MNKGILYYSANELDGTRLNDVVRKYILKAALPITSCTQLPIDFGKNVVYTEERSREGTRVGRSHTILYNQILLGLKNVEQNYVFFCEHDVLYHPTHFEFEPERDDIYYYDNNALKYRLSDRKVVGYDTGWLSQLCANRDLLISHYEKRLSIIASGKKAYGYEPGSGQSKKIDNVGIEYWKSPYPSIDIRHGDNWTGVKRMDPSEFRDKSTCQNFFEVDIEDVPGWDTKLLLSL